MSLTKDNAISVLLAAVVVAVLIIAATQLTTAPQTTGTPQSTPISTPTTIPSISPEVMGISAQKQDTTTQVDPIINCDFPKSGPIEMKSSKCDLMTDCELEPGKWQAVYQTDCDALHKNQLKALASENTTSPTTSPTPENLIYCSFKDGAGNYHTFNQVTEEDCSAYKSIWSTAKSYSPLPVITATPQNTAPQQQNQYDAESIALKNQQCKDDAKWNYQGESQAAKTHGGSTAEYLQKVAEQNLAYNLAQCDVLYPVSIY